METQLCTKCEETYPATLEFFHKGKGLQGLFKWCKLCRKRYDSEYHKKNKSKILAQKRKWRKRHGKEYATALIIAFSNIVQETLGPWKCVDCNETNPLVLEFDHIEPENKSFDITSKTYYCRSDKIELLIQELNKCKIRCANCHKIRTHEQRNTAKYRLYVANKV